MRAAVLSQTSEDCEELEQKSTSQEEDDDDDDDDKEEEEEEVAPAKFARRKCP